MSAVSWDSAWSLSCNHGVGTESETHLLSPAGPPLILAASCVRPTVLVLQGVSGHRMSQLVTLFLFLAQLAGQGQPLVYRWPSFLCVPEGMVNDVPLTRAQTSFIKPPTPLTQPPPQSPFSQSHPRTTRALSTQYDTHHISVQIKPRSRKTKERSGHVHFVWFLFGCSVLIFSFLSQGLMRRLASPSLCSGGWP